MPARIPKGVSRVQAARAVATRLRREIHNRIDALDGHQLTMTSRMAGLPAGFPSALRAAPPLPLLTRKAIGRRRLRCDGGILLFQRELPLQVVDLACLIRDLLRTLLELASQELVLAPQPLQLLRALICRASMTSSPLSLHRAERTKSLQKVQVQMMPRCQRA